MLSTRSLKIIVVFILTCNATGAYGQSHWPEVSSNASRLAISMLVTNIRGNDSTFKLLKASVFLYSKNLMPYTPTDLFIFTILEHLEELQRGFKTLMIVNPNVKIITIPDQQWAVPERVVNESHWRLRTRFPFGYRMMGDWRLTHQMR